MKGSLSALKDFVEVREDFLLDLLDHHPIGVMVVFKRKVLFASRGVEELFGWRRDQLIGRSTRIFFSDRASWMAFGERLYGQIEEKEEVVMEWPLKRRDGSAIICEIISKPLRRLPEGWTILSTLRDITREKQTLSFLKKEKQNLRHQLDQTLENLRRERDFFRRAIELAPVGIGIWEEGRLIIKNHLLKRHLKTGLPQEVARLLKELDQKKAFLQKVIRFEGEAGDQHILFSLAHIDNGQILIITEDITAGIRLKENLENLAQARVNRLLSQERLALMGRLLAGLTHEINTPLTFMKTNLQIFGAYIEALRRTLKGIELPEEKERLLGKILSEATSIARSLELGAERISEIVSSVKNLSKKEHTSGEVDLGEALHEALILTHNKTKRHLKILVNGRVYSRQNGVSPLGIRLEVRKSLIVQMMVILINNAAEVAQRRKIKRASLQIDIHPYGDRILLCFRDNCGGVPEEELSRIFESFYTTKEEGTGLGLYILKEIVNSLDGKLEVKRLNDPQGLQFRIILGGGKIFLK
ncbi:ATP-binding protein [Thermosulfuriphilus sp.]